jgi:uncharacterized protein with PQ loop repeat
MNKVKFQILIAFILVVGSPIALTHLLASKVLLDILPMGATFFLTACYLPQIVKTYKIKNVDSMAVSFWVMLNIALTLLLTNAFAIWDLFGTWGYLVTETLNEGLALVTLGQVLYYNMKNKK